MYYVWFKHFDVKVIALVPISNGMCYTSVEVFWFELGLSRLQEEAQAPSPLSSHKEGPEMETSCVTLRVGDEVS